MKSKLLLVGAVVGILAIGGGVGGYLMLMRGSSAATAAPVAESPRPAPEIPKTAFMPMDPIQLGYSQDGRRFQQLVLSINLEIEHPENVALVEKLMPRLRDAFIRELYARPLAGDGQLEAREVEAIKRRLMAQSERVVGAGVVSGVLVQNAMRIRN